MTNVLLLAIVDVVPSRLATATRRLREMRIADRLRFGLVQCNHRTYLTGEAARHVDGRVVLGPRHAPRAPRDAHVTPLLHLLCNELEGTATVGGAVHLHLGLEEDEGVLERRQLGSGSGSGSGSGRGARAGIESTARTIAVRVSNAPTTSAPTRNREGETR